MPKGESKTPEKEQEVTAKKEELTKEERRLPRKEEAKERELSEWVPKTALGKMVMGGKIESLDEMFATNMPIMEPEIIDSLSDLEDKIVDVKKTTRVVRSGRKFSFRVAVLVGNKNGYIGIGTAKDTEKWPAVNKALRRAKLNLIKIKRGCGSWECTCGTNHSVPFEVEGKNASIRVKLLPAPRGVELVAGDNIKDVLRFAGIEDVWTKTKGNTRTKLNFVRAAIDALSNTTKMHISDALEKEGAKELRMEMK